VSALDRTFRISLILKGLDGVLELVGGVLLLFVSPDQINDVVQFLTQHELAENPNDYLANHLVNSTSNLTASATLFGAIYLLLHGLVKVLLVGAVLRDKIWAYPWMIAFLVIFIGFQIYQIAVDFSIGLIILTAFDAFIVVLTVIEYRKRRRGRLSLPPSSGA
jgi:uncharacterized membrane protein